jgi:hypothetical protein
MATASRASAQKNQSCSAIWCAPTAATPKRAATAVADSQHT